MVNREKINANYQTEEKMMILIYAQWCVNHGLDPVMLYEKAYPGQGKNNLLVEAVAQTVSPDESEHISDATLLNALHVFENVDLAFVVQKEIEKRDKAQ